MPQLLTQTAGDGINVIAMDDGKANAMSVAMLTELGAALDAAEERGGPVVIAGKPGVFSGGFDLGAFKRGDPEEVFTMLKLGARISHRLLSFPNPTICACTGHAVAMGAFLLMSCDFRLGAQGDFKFAANEVAIGLTVPRFAVEVCRQRMRPAAFNLGLTLAHFFDTEAARDAGFLDELVAPEDVLEAAGQAARQFLALDLAAHTATKLRLRETALATLDQAIKDDIEEWAVAAKA